MEFYKFDKYYINNRIILNETSIYDGRIEKVIPISFDDYIIIREIFKYTSISDLTKFVDFDNENLKIYLEWLYKNDFLALKRYFYKNTVYSRVVTLMFLKAILIFLVRLFIIIVGFNTIIIKIPLIIIVKYFITFSVTFIAHELGHLITYGILNKWKFNIYINVDFLKFEVVIPVIKKFNYKAVAIMGPLSAGIISIILYILSKENIIIVFLLINILSLLPCAQDGKNLWDRNNDDKFYTEFE